VANKAVNGRKIARLGSDQKLMRGEGGETHQIAEGEYLFFWQASLEVREQRAAPGEEPLRSASEQAPAQLEPIRADVHLGIAFSNVIALFIILDTAAVLHAHGITDIQTSARATEALRPLVAGQ
jgi:Mn2+/Fe2+ NRAMP family transporter